ncbi:MAG: DUF1643 domain-containing protein [Planctomycetota bacterium]|nr:DUF1643 domain-containing protein [Planctomycetota bacterium]
MERSARLSPCGLYRYTLERHWDRSRGHALLVLLNPSTADATQDDPTLRRGVGFAEEWGYGGVVFVNLFAFRSTDPRALKNAVDPVGPDNDGHLLAQAARASTIVLAWGAHGTLLQRDRHVLRLLTEGGHAKLMTFGTTANGSPRHPLYVAKGTPLVKYAWS